VFHCSLYHKLTSIKEFGFFAASELSAYVY
jgi:hypothetical protein